MNDHLPINWADRAMYEAAPIETADGPRVFLLWMTPDPLGAIAAACRMYEGKPTYSLKDIVGASERKHYWDQVRKTHLKAPLEFVKFHFFIEGVTRAFTHQMVRQRTAVYAQESMRFAVKTNLVDEVAKPPALSVDDAKIWDDTIQVIQESYSHLVANGVPAEDARGLLPHATTTRLHYCTDLRSLLDHAGNRLCTQAQFEWREVFSKIAWRIRYYFSLQGEENWQGSLIADQMRPVCYELGHCPFQASFDRYCSIRDRVNEGKFDEIHPAEWLADPNAARQK